MTEPKNPKKKQVPAVGDNGQPVSPPPVKVPRPRKKKGDDVAPPAAPQPVVPPVRQDVVAANEEQPAGETTPVIVRRRNAAAPRQFNWLVLALIVAGIIIVWLVVTRPAAPVTDAPNDPDTVETVGTGSDNGNCPPLSFSEELISEGALVRVTEQNFLLSRPSANASAVRDLVVLVDDDLTVVSDQPRCEDTTYYMNVSLETSSGSATGWIPVYSSTEGWFITIGNVPAPVATEDAEADNSWTRGDALNIVRIGGGSCRPVLTAQSFHNANLDADPNWDGFWVWSSSNPGGLFIRESAGFDAPHVMINGEALKIAVGEPLEVRLYDDGFHYACADGVVWWSVSFHHIPTNSVYNGWVAEGDDGVMYIVGV